METIKKLSNSNAKKVSSGQSSSKKSSKNGKKRRNKAKRAEKDGGKGSLSPTEGEATDPQSVASDNPDVDLNLTNGRSSRSKRLSGNLVNGYLKSERRQLMTTNSPDFNDYNEICGENILFPKSTNNSNKQHSLLLDKNHNVIKKQTNARNINNDENNDLALALRNVTVKLKKTTVSSSLGNAITNSVSAGKTSSQSSRIKELPSQNSQSSSSTSTKSSKSSLHTSCSRTSIPSFTNLKTVNEYEGSIPKRQSLANESLRWEKKLEDPEAETARIQQYKLNRRKRYLAAANQKYSDWVKTLNEPSDHSSAVTASPSDPSVALCSNHHRFYCDSVDSQRQKSRLRMQETGDSPGAISPDSEQDQNENDEVDGEERGHCSSDLDCNSRQSSEVFNKIDDGSNYNLTTSNSPFSAASTSYNVKNFNATTSVPELLVSNLTSNISTQRGTSQAYIC